MAVKVYNFNGHTVQTHALYTKVREIQSHPYHFKPLRHDLKGLRRVHINKSFVLIYEIIESEKAVRLLDFDHHDTIYG